MLKAVSQPAGHRSMGFLAERTPRARTVSRSRPSADLLQFDGGETVSFADAAHNTLVLGTTGSGKTSCVVLPAAERLFAAGFGGLIIDIKGNMAAQVRALAARHGREKDVVEFGDGPRARRINLLAGVTPLWRNELLEQLFLHYLPPQDHNLSFHLRGLRCLSDAVELLERMAACRRRPFSLRLLARLLNDHLYAHEFYRTFLDYHYDADNIEEMDMVRRINGDRFHFLTANRELIDNVEWQEQVNFRLGALRTGFQLFCQSGDLEAHFFAPVGENLDIARRVYLRKNIVVLRLSASCGESGVALARILLREYYAAVMANGLALPEGQYTFCLMDEAQNFLCVNREDRYNDNAFLAVAREFRNISLMGAQSVAALVARTRDREAVEAMLGNFNVRVFLYSDDPLTARLADIHDDLPLTRLESGQSLLVKYDVRTRQHVRGRVGVQRMHDALRRTLAGVRASPPPMPCLTADAGLREKRALLRRQMALESAFLGRPPEEAKRRKKSGRRAA